MVKSKQVSVAKYIDQMLTLTPKSQKEIAAECGWDKPNVITMIKQGSTKLPVNKVGVLAKALGVDPVHLMRLTLSEYMPGTWAAIQESIGDKMVTENEGQILTVIRSASMDLEVPLTENRKKEITALFSQWAKEEKNSMSEPPKDARKKLGK